MRKSTKLLVSALALTGTYQNYALDLATLGSLAVNKRSVVSWHFLLSGVGKTVTFSPQELYGHQTTVGTEDVDYTDVQKDDGSGTMTATELTTTLAASTYSMSTTADNVRIRVKGTGTLTIYASVAETT